MAAAAIPSSVLYQGIQCSTAHITDVDNQLLWQVSHHHEEYGDSEWVCFTGSGYLIRLSAWSFPLLRLKRIGLSKAARRLVFCLVQRYPGITQIHLDALGDVLPGFVKFDW